MSFRVPGVNRRPICSGVNQERLVRRIFSRVWEECRAGVSQIVNIFSFGAALLLFELLNSAVLV